MELLFYLFKPAALVVCIVLACRSSSSNKTVRYVKRFVGQKIRYDRQGNRHQLRLAIGLTCFCVTFLALLVIIDRLLLVNDMYSGFTLMLGFNVTLLCLVLTVAAWAVYVDGLLYLKRLQNNGYMVPENKSKFVHLEHLPKVEGYSQKEKGISKESVVLAVLCWVMALIILIAAVRFWNEHSAIPDIMMYCMVIIAGIVIFWLVSGICFWRQRLYSKFRDDVELDTNRKKRIHIVSGLGFVIGIMIASRVAFLYMDFGADYIENAREQVSEQANVTTDFIGDVVGV